ncbi:hypothetical protein JTE90_013969 [Oedothorax gibbosus]|uniref:Uncharacterized protein n=1 Tax=Oedothorax gibbosus TaxID=931172 RepID=A0AAV6UDF3_9ARAC|nr:hypothetical protein JTE90_013969 [Oedothorax gibbosus]
MDSFSESLQSPTPPWKRQLIPEIYRHLDNYAPFAPRGTCNQGRYHSFLRPSNLKIASVVDDKELLLNALLFDLAMICWCFLGFV